MSRKSDEQYLFEQDSREKKNVARGARHTRTHCGKGGAVKFPSDYLTAKERKAMNGKVETYRMNSPISWSEFKTWPDEHKITYIKLLRQKYNAPDKAIAEMMGVSGPVVSKALKELDLASGKGASASRRKWDKEAFYIWSGKSIVTDEDLTKDDIEKITAKDDTSAIKPVDLTPSQKEEVRKNLEGYTPEPTIVSDICTNLYHVMPVIPMNGTMRFINNDADDALATMKVLLSNTKVNITISWETVSEQPKQEDLKKGVVAGTYALMNEERKKALGTKG